MKRICVFFCLVLLTAAFASSADLIPCEKIESVANRLVSQKFGADYRLSDAVPYYNNLDGLPNAYAFIYRNSAGDPVTIMMGARFTSTPVNEIKRGMPRALTNLGNASRAARALLSGEPVMSRAYYWGPCEEYIGFTCNGQEVLINAYSLQKFDRDLSRVVPDQNLERLTRGKWEKYLSITDYSTRQGGYVDSVPFIDWVYGCTPTAASMLFWYWDPRGYGKLVDFFFKHWDNPEGEWNDCANVNRELAIAMYTDTMTGGTSISNIRNGMINVANSNNGYSFSGSTSPQGNMGNQYVFSWAKTEIDAQRPFHWSILYYWYGPFGDFINHSITGVGYDIILPDTFIIVHTTWDNQEPLWPIWSYHNGTYSYDYVVTLVPGGLSPNNTLLTFPISSTTLFKNIKYRIKWQSSGTGIDHLKMWYSIGSNARSYDSLQWTLITNNAPNTGSYIWTAADQDSAFRINVTGLSASNVRYAADGVFSPCYPVFPGHSANVALVGHFETPGIAGDLCLYGAYAYTIDGTNGLYVADFSDSSLPDEIFHLQLPGDNAALDLQYPYLYLVDKNDTLRVVSITSPTNPTQTGKCYFDADMPLEIDASGTVAYAATRASGVAIFNVSNPSAPALITTFDTPGQAYDILVSDTIGYIADGLAGLTVVDISDPSNPATIGAYNTNGIAQGVDLNGSLLYLADGTMGLKIIDVSDPTNPLLIGSLNTAGTAKNVVYQSPSLALVADGSAVRIIDVSNPAVPVELGYCGSFGTTANFAYNGRMIYLADGSDGIYLIHAEITNIDESAKHDLSMQIKLQSPQKHALRVSAISKVPGTISVRIYDTSGRLLKAFDKPNSTAGVFNFEWDPACSGVYFVTLESDYGGYARKVVFLK